LFSTQAQRQPSFQLELGSAEATTFRVLISVRNAVPAFGSVRRVDDPQHTRFQRRSQPPLQLCIELQCHAVHVGIVPCRDRRPEFDYRALKHMYSMLAQLAGHRAKRTSLPRMCCPPLSRQLSVLQACCRERPRADSTETFQLWCAWWRNRTEYTKLGKGGATALQQQLNPLKPAMHIPADARAAATSAVAANTLLLPTALRR
jgi:hypothetical protein